MALDEKQHCCAQTRMDEFETRRTLLKTTTTILPARTGTTGHVTLQNE